MTLRNQRPRLAALLATVVVTGLALAGCSSGPLSAPPANPGTGTSEPVHSTTPTPPPTPTPTPDPVQLTSNVKDGASGVKVSTVVKVKATDGTLSKVSVSAPVTDRNGKTSTVPVKGKLNKAKTEWTATDLLEPGAKYTVTATGANKAGTTAEKTTTFTTQKLALDDQIWPSITPMGGSNYGIAMPIIVKFDIPVKDKAAFEKKMIVTSSPKQEGTWSWLSDTEAHYRTKHYWKPGTKVTVDLKLNGVAAGNGKYGQLDRSTSFTISKTSVILKTNVSGHTTKVVVNGKVTRTIPISAGRPENGYSSITRYGTKVVMWKTDFIQMNSDTIGISKESPDGFDIPVHWALKLTNTGEFYHGAPWNAGYFGRVNASHGCTGMSDANAHYLYDVVPVGAPAVFTGADRPIERGNGWDDWNLSWKQFKKGSALS